MYLKPQMISERYYGVEAMTFSLSQIYWSKYLDHYISSSRTTANSFLILIAEILASLVISMAK